MARVAADRDGVEPTTDTIWEWELSVQHPDGGPIEVLAP